VSEKDLDLSLDADLVVALGHALDQEDPVPADAVDTAVALFGLGRVDTELAELVFDSARDRELITMRSDPETAHTRTLSFATDRITVDVELSASGSVLLGQLSPPAPADVALETTAGSQEARCDELGRFRFVVARGTMRLHIDATDASSALTTPWFTW
jgi:hypothetical protein